MNPRNAFCSFCRKSRHDVGPLVEGPDQVYICSECVPLCQSIIEQEKRRRNIKHGGTAHSDSRSVREVLDRIVAGQEHVKAVLTEAARSRHEVKGRVLLIGPSQSSAMFLAKALAYALDVPFGGGDSSDLAKSGKGNPFFNLLDEGDFDVESAQRGVVFVAGMERPGAQEALSKLWQENVSSPLAGLELQVQGILFVCGATFVELDEATARLGRHTEQDVTVDVLRTVGVRAEWAAALTATARVAPFDEETLARIVNCVDFRRA